MEEVSGLERMEGLVVNESEGNKEEKERDVVNAVGHFHALVRNISLFMQAGG